MPSRAETLFRDILGAPMPTERRTWEQIDTDDLPQLVYWVEEYAGDFENLLQRIRLGYDNLTEAIRRRDTDAEARIRAKLAAIEQRAWALSHLAVRLDTLRALLILRAACGPDLSVSISCPSQELELSVSP